MSRRLTVAIPLQVYTFPIVSPVEIFGSWTRVSRVIRGTPKRFIALCKAESSTNHVGASYGLMEKVACIAIAMGLKATFQTENPKS